MQQYPCIRSLDQWPLFARPEFYKKNCWYQYTSCMWSGLDLQTNVQLVGDMGVCLLTQWLQVIATCRTRVREIKVPRNSSTHGISGPYTRFFVTTKIWFCKSFNNIKERVDNVFCSLIYILETLFFFESFLSSEQTMSGFLEQSKEQIRVIYESFRGISL